MVITFYLLCIVSLLVLIVPLVMILRMMRTLVSEQMNNKEMEKCISQSKNQQLKELRQEVTRISKALLMIILALVFMFVLFVR